MDEVNKTAVTDYSNIPIVNTVARSYWTMVVALLMTAFTI